MYILLNSIIKKYLWSKFRRFHKCGKFAFRRSMILSSYTLFFCLCHIQSFVSITILFKCCLKTIHMKSIGSIESKSIVCVDSITSYDNTLQFIINVPSRSRSCASNANILFIRIHSIAMRHVDHHTQCYTITLGSLPNNCLRVFQSMT